MKIRPLLKIHGGQFYQCNNIIKLFPKGYEKITYVEPFIGGGSVFLNKKPSMLEHLNDIDPHIYNVWRQTCDDYYNVIYQLSFVKYYEDNFNTALMVLRNNNSPKIDLAISKIVQSRFSRGGMGKTFAWSDRERGGKPEQLNSWDTYRTKTLPQIHNRLHKDVSINNDDAINFIKHFLDNKDVVIYLDPPFLPETRTAKQVYSHEMTEQAHEEMLGLLVSKDVKAKILLSGYKSDLYDNYLSYKGWEFHEFETANHSGQGKKKQRRTACLWRNFTV